MRQPLQQTGYRESPYERPNQKYVCGWADDGRPCRMGPTRKGNCTAAAQATCTPRREGDRWMCGRLEPFGGPCEHGPLPDGSCCHPEPEHAVCQPRLCHRARRGRLTLLCATLALGLVVMMLAGPWSMAFISPGELTAAHSAIEPATGQATNCSACHSGADGSAANFLLAAFRGDATPTTIAGSATDQAADNAAAAHAHAIGDSAKCVACHFIADDRDRDHVMAAHSIDPHVLKQITASRTADDSLPQAPATPAQTLAAMTGPPDQHAIACAVCHHEHRGRAHDITYLSDTSCQVCHTDRFDSFSHGHPEFGLVAHGRAGVAFDHQTHSEAHFGDTTFDCSRCHVPDAKGFSMLVRPYAESCAGCHNQGRDDHHGDEIRKNAFMVVQLPEMEFDDDVYWPMDTAIGERIPPLMRILLAGDPAVRPALKAFVEDPDAWGIPYDWEPDDESLKAKLAAGLKRVVADLTHPDEAPQRLAERLTIALGTTPGDSRVRALAAQIAAGRFPMRAWQTTWLKQVADDLAGKEVDLDEEPDEPDWDPAGLPAGWFIDPRDAAVRYSPAAHADPLSYHLLDLLADRADPTSLPADLNAEIPPAKDDAQLLARIRTIAFQDLASPDFGGPLYASCLRCHSLERTDGRYRINWTAIGRYPLTTGYGKFNHSPHMAILTEPDNCKHCHTIAPKDADPSTVAHGFVAHQRATCAACHAPNKAPNNCVTCHLYHMNRP